MDGKISVLVAEDHPLFRQAICGMLIEAEFIDEVDEAENGLVAMERLRTSKYDMVLLDINMPELDGIGCMTEIQCNYPEQKVVVLTQYDTPGFYKKFEALGAAGYLLKSSTEDEIVNAIHRVVFENQKMVSTNVSKALQNIDYSEEVDLSYKEFDVVRLMCQHLTSEQIGEKMNLSVHTVHSHRKNIMKKIGATVYTEIMEWAKDNDLVPKRKPN